MVEMRQYLLCVDGSENAVRAARFAGRTATGLSGRVTVLLVLKEKEARELKEDMRDEDTGITGERINAAVDVLEEEGCSFVTSLQIGDPAEVILEMSNSYEAVIMGYKGMGAIASALMGSVTDKVLHGSKRPVVLVP